jgi:putative transposase
LELVRYIHLNPLRASAVKSIDELDRYAWSGHAFFYGKETEYVLRQFGRERKRVTLRESG